jgi:exodeoxyribonuclease V alpha subunit
MPAAAGAAGCVAALATEAQPAAVLHLALHGRAGAEGCYRDYLQRLAQRPTDADAHAAWVTSGAAGLRALSPAVRGARRRMGREGSTVRIERRCAQRRAADAGRAVSGMPGGRCWSRATTPALGVFNGDIGMACPRAARRRPARVLCRWPATALGGRGRLAHVETAFAMTVHKARARSSSTPRWCCRRSAGALLTRELVYTGITRARQAFTLVARDAPGCWPWSGSAQRTQRASGCCGACTCRPMCTCSTRASPARTASIHLRVALHGRSFKDAATLDNLAVGYPQAVPGWLNIGVLHTALQGDAAHARYAPCSLA